MSRRTTSVLLAFSLFGTLVAPMFTSVVHAQDWYADDADAAAAASHIVPSKAKILQMVQDGKVAEAEESYLQWVNTWQEDDAELTAAIESHILTSIYANGNLEAYLALVQAGDSSSLFELRSTMIEIDQEKSLSDVQMAMAVSSLGAFGALTDAEYLSRLLTYEKPAVAKAAADALVGISAPDAIVEFIEAMPEVNLDLALHMARAMVKIGAAQQVSARYTPQLTFPMEGIKERSAFILATTGDTRVLEIIKSLLDAKDPKFYPAGLSALGNLPSSEVAEYITAGLQGSEEEKLAALSSVNALPLADGEKALTDLLKDKSFAVRNTALQALAERRTKSAQEILRKIAFAEDSDAQLKTAAMLAMARNGAFASFAARKSLYMQVLADEDQQAIAPRAALLMAAQLALK